MYYVQHENFMFLMCITGPVTVHVPKVYADGGAPGNSSINCRDK